MVLPTRKRALRRVHVLGFFAALGLVACGLDLVGVASTSDSRDGGVDARIGAPTDTSMPDAAPFDANPCAECAGPLARTLCTRQGCLAGHRVFITSARSTAALGGTAGADATCQSSAENAGLVGTWRAWLSTSDGDSPSVRFEKAKIPYRRLDGTIIANDWADLVTPPLLAPINRDENGAVVTGPDEVWTGTEPNGEPSFPPGGCAGFTDGMDASPSLVVTVGYNNQTSSQWTNRYTQFCNRADQHLYCFEQ